jgi:hypothetical protein
LKNVKLEKIGKKYPKLEKIAQNLEKMAKTS